MSCQKSPFEAHCNILRIMQFKIPPCRKYVRSTSVSNLTTTWKLLPLSSCKNMKQNKCKTSLLEHNCLHLQFLTCGMCLHREEEQKYQQPKFVFIYTVHFQLSTNRLSSLKLIYASLTGVQSTYKVRSVHPPTSIKWLKNCILLENFTTNCQVIQFSFSLDSFNNHFTQRPTCIFACSFSISC